ncbi:MAG: hypothetical protein WCF17_13325 [Terracidiphilus sp.]
MGRFGSHLAPFLCKATREVFVCAIAIASWQPIALDLSEACEKARDEAVWRIGAEIE